MRRAMKPGQEQPIRTATKPNLTPFFGFSAFRLTGGGSPIYSRCSQPRASGPNREATSVSKKKTNDKPQVIGLVGVGMDQKDGQMRITRNEDMLLVGGSAETHERLQDVSIRFNDSLKEQ